MKIYLDGVELKKVCINGIDIPEPKTIVVDMQYDSRINDLTDISKLMHHTIIQKHKQIEDDIGIVRVVASRADVEIKSK